MSSAPLLLKELARRCRGGHLHTRLLGGRRAAEAAVYSPGLCRAILRGIARQYQREGRVVPAGVGRACQRGVGVYALRDEPPQDAKEMAVDEAQTRVEGERDALKSWGGRQF